VLCEKPLVTRVEQARELVALARKRKRLLGIAFQAPVSPEYAYIRDVLRRGELGQIEMIDAFVAQGWLNLTKGTWRQKPEQSGGGQLYDSGAHLFNGMLWLIESPVERVFAMVDNWGTPVEINGTLSIRFANGVLASVAVPGNARGPCETGLHIYGSKGTIKTGIWGLELKHYDGDNQQIQYPFVPYEPLTPTQNFIDAIRGNDTLRCSPEMGIRLAELMDAVYESVRTQMPVDIAQDSSPRRKRRK
jgi:predicted dehydrogenase